MSPGISLEPKCKGGPVRLREGYYHCPANHGVAQYRNNQSNEIVVTDQGVHRRANTKELSKQHHQEGDSSGS